MKLFKWLKHKCIPSLSFKTRYLVEHEHSTLREFYDYGYIARSLSEARQTAARCRETRKGRIRIIKLNLEILEYYE